VFSSLLPPGKLLRVEFQFDAISVAGSRTSAIVNSGPA
jgi:hypothetical protein